MNDEALGRGAPELFLFSNQIAPWQPADSLAIVKLMALQLSAHLENEVLRARTSLLLPDDAAARYPARRARRGHRRPARLCQPVPGRCRDTPRPPRAPTIRCRRCSRRGLAGASNAWAAAPNRAATGATLLANDPHLGFTAPSIWYLARLELQSGGVIGGTIPGMPVVLVGRGPTGSAGA